MRDFERDVRPKGPARALAVASTTRHGCGAINSREVSAALRYLALGAIRRSGSYRKAAPTLGSPRPLPEEAIPTHLSAHSGRLTRPSWLASLAWPGNRSPSWLYPHRRREERAASRSALDSGTGADRWVGSRSATGRASPTGEGAQPGQYRLVGRATASINVYLPRPTRLTKIQS